MKNRALADLRHNNLFHSLPNACLKRCPMDFFQIGEMETIKLFKRSFVSSVNRKKKTPAVRQLFERNVYFRWVLFHEFNPVLNEIHLKVHANDIPTMH